MAWWDKLGVLGKRVDKAAANLPQTAAGGLFTISGGRILLTAIVGEVTTIIQNIAVNAKLNAAPTTGGGADICANLNIQNFAVGRLLGITGVPADAMVSLGGVVAIMTQPFVLKPGTLQMTTDANATGQVKWSLFYQPIDDEANVVAA